MTDLLVKLYELPPVTAVATVNVRRAFAAEKTLVSEWVACEFHRGWADECDAAFARSPVACFLATEADQLRGFACYDATARGFFGPTGVAKSARGGGVGHALLLATLHDMRANGYGYAVIGATDSPDFYKSSVGAIEIADSAPGFYRGFLGRK